METMSLPLLDDLAGRAPIMHEKWLSDSLFFIWFSKILEIGFSKRLSISDLTRLPDTMRCKVAQECLHVVENAEIGVTWKVKPSQMEINDAVGSLIYVFAKAHWKPFLYIGFLKALSSLSSFGGPILLGMMVSYIENDSGNGYDITQGLLLVFLLASSFLVSAALNVVLNTNSGILKMKLKGSLTTLLFSRALSLPQQACAALRLSEAKLITLIQVDVDRVSSIVSSIHDLWTLVLQLCVAFVLLYLQVEVAFIAGVVTIVLMIPMNTAIASGINTATQGMMTHKDLRVNFLTEALRGIRSVKMLSLESAILDLSNKERTREMSYLKKRKYLDAVCVFLWASMPVLVPFVTFSASVILLKKRLKASEVFTTLALLNMLIFPMNAFPWILNGLIEARVSVMRIATVFCSASSSKALQFSAYVSEFEGGMNSSYDPDENSEFITDVAVGVAAPTRVSVKDVIWVHYSGPDGAAEKASPQPSYEEVEEEANTDGESPDNVTEMLLPQRHNAHSQLPAFTLGPLNIEAHAGSLWGVAGAVASGKTTLLQGLLGEVALLQGSVNVFHSSSYCAQIPSIHAGSLRDNILMGAALDVQRYAVVIAGCQLEEDIHSANWPLGDLTNVGEGGAALSGGQRLRLGIARAVYARSSVVVLDDPFASLDGRTASLLVSFLLDHVCSYQRRVVFVATHAVHLLERADAIVVLQCGREVCRGSFYSLSQNSVVFKLLLGRGGDGRMTQSPSTSHEVVQRAIGDIDAPLALIPPLTHRDTLDTESSSRFSGATEALTEPELEIEAGSKVTDSVGAPIPSPDADVDTSKDCDNDNADVDFIEGGKIDLAVYVMYLRAAGFGVTSLVVLSTLMMQLASNGMSFWLAFWTSKSTRLSAMDFLYGSLIIISVDVFFTLARSFLFAFGCLKAADEVYKSLTKSVFHTNVNFFEQTSVGKIVNRFGKDTFCIDDQLPFILNIVLAQFFLLLGSFFSIAYTDPLVIPIVLIVGALYYRLQKFYRRSSRVLRRMESAYRSPVFSVICDCAANAVCLRSLGSNCVAYFQGKLQSALDDAQRVSLAMMIANQWLNIRMQLLGGLVATALALSAVLSSSLGFTPVSPALLGLSLSYSLNIVGNLNGLIGALAETEQEMISVERVKEYIGLQSEFGIDEKNHRIPPNHVNKRRRRWWRWVFGRPRPLKQSVLLRSPMFHQYRVHLLEHVLDLVHIDDLELGRDSGIGSSGNSDKNKILDVDCSKPAVEFVGVNMRYASGLPLALCDVTFSVMAGSRVAVCGRTGGGKSSLLRVLLRMCGTYNGTVKICGTDINALSTGKLRERLVVIPQDPLVLSGTVRLNLDPRGKHSDKELMLALTRCGFLDTLSKGSAAAVSKTAGYGILDKGLHASSEELSQGQKQLMSLARALLSLSCDTVHGHSQGDGNTQHRVILIDEATAAVDAGAELALVKAISTLFMTMPPSSFTFIMICHKEEGLRSLCNKVLILDNGRVLSYTDT